MNTQIVMNFLREVAANNNRPWFQEHRDEYLECRSEFEQLIDRIIAIVSRFDPEIAHLSAHECCYRFYRDVRFSPDKSPYKRHFGAYICAHGRKSLRGGYYIHVQPGMSLFAVGVYFLPTNILTSCRNEIMANIDTWRSYVESPAFIRTYGRPNEGVWTDEKVSAKGFGISHLKTAPKDFPRDYPFLEYLKMKDYTAWRAVPDDYFEGDGWEADLTRCLKIGKPMMDMLNAVVDDYE